MEPNVVRIQNPKPRMLVKVWGEEDDTIVVSQGTDIADHRFTISSNETASCYLHFSEGTVLHCWYEAEHQTWKIIHHFVGKAKTDMRQAVVTEGDTRSDVCRITGNIKWVACWRDANPADDELQDQLEEFRWREIEDYDKLMKLWKLANDLT